MGKFSAVDIAGIKDATVEELLRVEAQAERLEKEMAKRMEEDMRYATDDNISTLKWYIDVQSSIDYRLKEIGARQKEEWEKLFN